MRRLGLPKAPELLVGVDSDGQPVQRGTADATVSVSTLNGGELGTAPGLDDVPTMAFPAFRSAGPYPRAVVQARVNGPTDTLNPDVSRFLYGADIKLDADSAGRSEDNGNNVIQRGLSSDTAMFKLEMDADRRPGCTVQGSAGSLSVLSPQPVEPGMWYRVRCQVRRNVIRVLVTEYLPSGSAMTSGRENRGAVGPVAFPGTEVPVAIGGKLAQDGSVITSATDQFNGLIVNAFVVVGRVFGSDRAQPRTG